MLNLPMAFCSRGDSIEWFDAAYRAEASHIRTSPLAGDLTGMPPPLSSPQASTRSATKGVPMPPRWVRAGVAVVFREALGNVHGFITLRKAIPSSAGDVAGALAAAKVLIAEAEGQRVMQQAAA